MKKLILILLLAFTLRFYRLDVHPALNADEAAIGYNAYSLIQTGKDEHGNSWPIHFQSFNDYKPGLYFYLVSPFVKVLGLNEWAVRIPGALLGVLTVLIVYILANELFGSKFRIWPALLLAISPWHIHFSRGGWEVNAGTFFISLGVLFFLRGLKNPKNFAFCVLNFALAMYTYHAARIVVPLLSLGMLFIYRNELLKSLKVVLAAGIFALVLFIPLAKDLLGPAGISRAAGVGLFADLGPLSRINEQRGEHSDFQGLIPKAIHNKVVNYGLAFLANWVSHYHGEFLFLSGDSIQRDKVPETGEMYLFDILFLVIGGWWLMKNFNCSTKLIIWWLAVAPAAAALTFQSPHALRAHNLVIPLTIISALGLSYLVTWFSARNLKIVNWLLVIAIAWSLARYLHMYWVHMAKEYPYSSQYGVKELVNYLEKESGNYSRILVTDRYDQPYILFLFYEKYSPAQFQKEQTLTARDQFGFSTVRDFGKYHFEAIDFAKMKSAYPGSLIIGTPEEIPAGTDIKKRIFGANGFEYFDVVAN